MEIRSVSEYLTQCLSNPLLKKTDREVFYRGVRHIYPKTAHLPSLYFPPDNFMHNESLIYKEALSYLPELLAQQSTVEKLIMMQHYRFPTRIMDISKNPLVALFFACFQDMRNDPDKDRGIVYLYSVPKKEIRYCDSDSVSVVANLCKCHDDFDVTRKMHCKDDDFKKDDWVIELVHNIKEEKPYFENHITYQAINSVFCLRPRMNNPRIIRQDGYFFLFGINGKKENCAKMKDEWISEIEFVIPSNRKDAILQELDLLNINEAFVYPDFEHISNSIRNKYTSKKKL